MTSYCCNNCYSLIHDYRYKCLACVDFDLCETCCLCDDLPKLNDHDHDVHVFLKIKESTTSPSTSIDSHNTKVTNADTLMSQLKLMDSMGLFQLSTF